MLAFWLIGFEADSADDSGENCVIELFGDSIGTRSSELSIGVKAHHDPRLHDDMARVALDVDASAWHTYSAAWTTEQVRFLVDDHLVRTVEQGFNYPMQLMVDLFEFHTGEAVDPLEVPQGGRNRPGTRLPAPVTPVVTAQLTSQR